MHTSYPCHITHGWVSQNTPAGIDMHRGAQSKSRIATIFVPFLEAAFPEEALHVPRLERGTLCLNIDNLSIV